MSFGFFSGLFEIAFPALFVLSFCFFVIRYGFKEQTDYEYMLDSKMINESNKEGQLMDSLLNERPRNQKRRYKNKQFLDKENEAYYSESADGSDFEQYMLEVTYIKKKKNLKLKTN